jgi:hypothetical protein
MGLNKWVSSKAMVVANTMVQPGTGLFGGVMGQVRRILVAIDILRFMGVSYKVVSNQYHQICKGGNNRLSPIQLSLLRMLFVMTLRTNAVQYKNAPNFSKLQAAAVEINDEMIRKLQAGDFDFCSCQTYLQKTAPHSLMFARMRCLARCNSGTVTLDENVVPDEYMEE